MRRSNQHIIWYCTTNYYTYVGFTAKRKKITFSMFFLSSTLILFIINISPHFLTIDRKYSAGNQGNYAAATMAFQQVFIFLPVPSAVNIIILIRVMIEYILVDLIFSINLFYSSDKINHIFYLFAIFWWWSISFIFCFYKNCWVSPLCRTITLFHDSPVLHGISLLQQLNNSL